MIVWITLWCCRSKQTFKKYNGGGKCIRMILKNASCSYDCTSEEARERRERGREERESVSSSRQQQQQQQQQTHFSNKSALSNTERTIAEFDFTHVVARRKKSSTKYGKDRMVSMDVKYLVRVCTTNC